MTGVIVAQQWEPTAVIHHIVIVILVVTIPFAVAIPWACLRPLGHLIILMITILLGVMESSLWVVPSLKLILHLCIGGQRPGNSSECIPLSK